MKWNVLANNVRVVVSKQIYRDFAIADWIV